MEPKADLREILQSIYDQKGELTPELVVQEAAQPDSPLRGYFDWDDSSAAHRFRLFQAAALIRRVKITVETSPERRIQVRAYTHVPQAQSYLPTPEALARHHDMVLADARRALASLRRKYENLVDFDALLREELERRNRSESEEREVKQ